MIDDAYRSAVVNGVHRRVSVLVALIETHRTLARTSLVLREQHTELLVALWDNHLNYDPARYDHLIHASQPLAHLGQEIMESLYIALQDGIEGFMAEE